MFPNPEALKLITGFLSDHQIPYMVIGGVASSVWGEARVTQDADLKVAIGEQSISEFRQWLLSHFAERKTNIPPHLQSPYVIPLSLPDGTLVDVLISVFDYEREAIGRALTVTIVGVPARVCTAEDLIIHKVTANRDKDWRDIERILARQKSKLDQAYILHWLQQFAEGLDTPEILTRYQHLRARYDPSPSD